MPLSSEAQELDFWCPELPVRVEVLSLRCESSGPNMDFEISSPRTRSSWDAAGSGPSGIVAVDLAYWKPRWPTIEKRRRCEGLVLCVGAVTMMPDLLDALVG